MWKSVHVFIAPKQVMYGFPAIIVRNVIREFPAADAARPWQAACRIVRDKRKAEALVNTLLQDGYLAEFRGSGDYYSRTDKGQRFAMASGRPLRRATADRILAALVERAHQINANNDLCYRVSALIVFGSYMDQGRELLGDVDIGYLRADRFSNEGPQYETEMCLAQKQRTRLAVDSGRRFSNIVEEIYWPQIEFLRALKGRTAGLSLHDFSDEMEIILGGPHELVFPLRAP